MLEAAQRGPRFTISLKRSTQKSSAIHKLVGRLPHLLLPSLPNRCIAAVHGETGEAD
jgi:hypothetical protein